MNPRRCLQLADRIDALLQQRLGRGIDLQRMLAEPLYARDVLLVCDAHRGEELADLARQFREAAAEAPPPEEAAGPASDWGRGASGFVSSLLDAFRPSQPTSQPPADAAAAELQRRKQGSAPGNAAPRRR